MKEDDAPTKYDPPHTAEGWRTPMVPPTVSCDNCDWSGPVAALASASASLMESPDLAERLDPGGIVPAGTCLECGAFCYLAEPDLPAAVETFTDEEVADVFWEYLDCDPDHKDRRQTAWGTKTKTGLAAVIRRLGAGNRPAGDARGRV